MMLVMMIYPIVVLIMLTRPAIVAAFREPALPSAEEWETEAPMSGRWEEPPSDAITR